MSEYPPQPSAPAAAERARERGTDRLVRIAAEGLAALGLCDPSTTLLNPIAKVIAELTPQNAEADKGATENAR